MAMMHPGRQLAWYVYLTRPRCRLMRSTARWTTPGQVGSHDISAGMCLPGTAVRSCGRRRGVTTTWTGELRPNIIIILSKRCDRAAWGWPLACRCYYALRASVRVLVTLPSAASPSGERGFAIGHFPFRTIYGNHIEVTTVLCNHVAVFRSQVGRPGCSRGVAAAVGHPLRWFRAAPLARHRCRRLSRTVLGSVPSRWSKSTCMPPCISAVLATTLHATGWHLVLWFLVWRCPPAAGRL